jgi:hypothetical protein
MKIALGIEYYLDEETDYPEYILTNSHDEVICRVPIGSRFLKDKEYEEKVAQFYSRLFSQAPVMYELLKEIIKRDRLDAITDGFYKYLVKECLKEIGGKK